jgi:hypothetical protein
MKKFNLAKELLFNGVLIGVLSIGLASCGGGGGGGSSSSTSLPSGCISPSTPLSYSLATYICSGGYNGGQAGAVYFNAPIITVYIDGQPVNLLADTGESGLVVDSSVVNIPSSDIYSSYTFPEIGAPNIGISGVMASATVCLNPSITKTCVVMPIGLITSTSDNPYPANGVPQGDFGLASGLNSEDIGYNSSGSSITGFSYPYYLEKQYGINSYTISFYPLSNNFYANVPFLNTPIGYISFGVYNGNSNTLISYTMGLFSTFPSTTVIFPSSNPSIPSFTGHAIFDTGSYYNNFDTNVFQTEIPNFSQSADEGSCFNYGFPPFIVNGGFVISYSLQNYSGSFTTEPSLSFCEAGIPFTLMEGITADNGFVVVPSGYEFFGLSAMLGHTFTWVLGTSGTNQGFVQDIGISP